MLIDLSLKVPQLLPIAAQDTAFTTKIHRHHQIDPQLAFLLWKVKLCTWLMILDDCFVVRHGSISCFGEVPKGFVFAINSDVCSELLSCLGHSIEICGVVASHKFSFFNFWNFFFDVDHVRKIQIRLWTFCLDGSEIKCNGSLLCRAKHTKVVSSVINLDLCSEPVLLLAHTSVSNRVGG